MEDKVKIIHLGGQDEIGKNLTVVEINNDIFVLDCGIKMPDKTKHGIDFIIPRFDYLLENKERIRAYILTKGKDRIIGGLPYIIKRAPARVYCTDVTKVFLESFCKHHRANVQFDFDIVNPNDTRFINGRKIRFFQTTSNLARSFGVAISTDRGNIVFIDDFVIDSNCDKGYVTSTKMFSEITSEDTLLLMLDSQYANRAGYTNPKFKIVPLIERTFKEAPGRIFVALETNDIYNIEMTIKFGVRCGKKIYGFDEATREIYHKVVKSYQFEIPSDSIGSLDDVGRANPKETLIIMSGFGTKAYNKIALFASGQYSDKRLKLIPGDTFIIGLHTGNSTETLASEAVDELYKTEGVKIIYFNKKDYLKMHASEEDIKTMLSAFRPKYYAPINGMYTGLLANAKISLEMGIGLNHTNVFVLDNGMILELENGKCHISNETVITGDLLVDGINIGDTTSQTLEDRRIFGDDGAIIVGFAYSKSKKAITFGPDIQIRGLVTVKESERILKELTKLLQITLASEFNKNDFNKAQLESNIIDSFSRAARRITLKQPKIITTIIEEQ